MQRQPCKYGSAQFHLKCKISPHQIDSYTLAQTGCCKRGKAAAVVHRDARSGGQLGSSGPQQYGIWEVEGLGLVVAFRGTASQEDVLVDVNIMPVELQGILPHGAPRHLLQSIVDQCVGSVFCVCQEGQF